MNILINCSNAYQVCVGRGIALFKNAVFLILFSVIFLEACAGREEKSFSEKSNAVADSVSNYIPGIATDTINGITHNFIRNANVKCKVKDVLSCTKQLEQLATNVGGYTTKSDLNANQDYCENIHFKKDSLLELTHYTSASNIILRVPNKYLDSVLSGITDMSVFVDFRTVNCDDVKMKLYANQLAERRYHRFKNRVENHADKISDKLNRETEAEEKALEKQSLADDKRIETYELADQVNYSTIMVCFYQSQNTVSGKKALPATIETYEPSFISKLGASFLNGFESLKSILLFFIDMWGVIFILVALFFIAKKIVTHYSKSSPAINPVQNGK